MEEFLFAYKNTLRNSLIVLYRVVIIATAISGVILFDNELYSAVVFGIAMILLSYLKILKVYFYHDATVFKERGFYPTQRNDFGIAFENTESFEIRPTIIQPLVDKVFGTGKRNFVRIIFSRKNGKSIHKIFSFKRNELSEFSKTLNEKILEYNS